VAVLPSPKVLRSYIRRLGSYGSECASESVEKDALGRGDNVSGQSFIFDGKCEFGKLLLKRRFLPISLASGKG
jgi:hypothetical protein